MDVPYTIKLPDYFEDYAAEIEAKGYFADMIVDAEGRQYRPVFYDAVRFQQECEDHLAAGAPAFAEPNLVVVRAVTRDQIEAAVAELSRTGFRALVPESVLAPGFSSKRSNLARDAQGVEEIGAAVENIVLNVDQQTAIDLRDLIYGFGEHVAAGAPLPEFDTAADERLRAVLDELERGLESAS